MKLGAFTACLHDRPLPEALAVLADLGLTSAEVNAGGFVPAPHLPVEQLRTSAAARDDYLGIYADAGITLTGLNTNGNPLHPVAAVRDKHSADVRNTIELAGLLGVRRVVVMSGLPGTDPSGKYPSWAPAPWDSALLDVQEYQWNEVGVPFWAEMDSLARDADVKICVEMHPHTLAFNPKALMRLVERTKATNLGAEMDPSHLFWQGIDPVAAIEYLGDLVFHAAAKDTRINTANSSRFGVLEDSYTRWPADEEPIPLGGGFTINKWPAESPWDFVAIGRGHDVEFWSRFLAALAKVDPDIAVNIEHEDQELSQVEGLQTAAQNLIAAKDLAGV